MRFWSGTAFLTATEILPVATMFDQAGFDGLICADHMVYPRNLSSPYPSQSGKPMWSPQTSWPASWVLIGAMAAVTKHLCFTNAVYIAPARPLIEVAKQVATASALSDGRVSLAVGAGWMREEFELMGQNFEDRGRRLNEMIPALRALWQGGWVSWSGDYYQVPELMMEPHPDARVPILCGGDSKAALRRAAQLCDGWVGTSYTWDDAIIKIEHLKKLRSEFGRTGEPFDIMLALREPPSIDLYKRAEDIGVTDIMCSPWSGSGSVAEGDLSTFSMPADRYREPIERFADTIITKFR